MEILNISISAFAIIIAAIIGGWSLKRERKVKCLEKTQTSLLKDWLSYHAIEEKLIADISAYSGKSIKSIKDETRDIVKQETSYKIQYTPGIIQKMLN